MAKNAYLALNDPHSYWHK